MPDRALLVIDVQNDFCPGGALPVPGGDEVVPVLNAYAERFARASMPVYASRDWHPVHTKHFQELGGPWPPHCVQNTRGAELHPELRLPRGWTLVSGGTDPESHGYSAFEATDSAGRSLATSLADNGVRHLYVGGLATDYCVKASVLDGLREGLDVVLLEDAVRGIDVEPGDVERALSEMKRAGARTATLQTIGKEIEQ